jgi:hypothetical protein
LSNKNDKERQERLKEIEDRKIEILLEIACINDYYGQKVSRLNSEYKQLSDEYYQLKMEMIMTKQKA